MAPTVVVSAVVNVADGAAVAATASAQALANVAPNATVLTKKANP